MNSGFVILPIVLFEPIFFAKQHVRRFIDSLEVTAINKSESLTFALFNMEMEDASPLITFISK